MRGIFCSFLTSHSCAMAATDMRHMESLQPQSGGIPLHVSLRAARALTSRSRAFGALKASHGSLGPLFLVYAWLEFIRSTTAAPQIQLGSWYVLRVDRSESTYNLSRAPYSHLVTSSLLISLILTFKLCVSLPLSPKLSPATLLYFSLPTSHLINHGTRHKCPRKLPN